MNFESYNKDSKKTSIKCHHPPGGSANFSLGWTKSETFAAKVPFDHNPYPKDAVNVEDKENNTFMSNSNQGTFLNFNDEAKKTTIKTDYSNGKNNFNIFNENVGNVDKTKSIKVACAPGGKSNFVFGDDTTSYEDYRRKR